MSQRSEVETHQARQLLEWSDQYGSFTSASTSLSREHTNFLDGSEDPEWKAKVSQNVDATGPLTAERTRYIWQPSPVTVVTAVAPNGYTQYTKIGGALAWVPKYSFNVNDFADILGSTDNRALVKLHKDIQARDTVFSGGTFLGELRETIKMIRSPARALRQGFSNYLNDVRDTVRNKVRVTRRVDKWREIQRVISGLWLEYVYGWRPLVNDIRDLSSVFAHNADFFYRSSARGHAYQEKTAYSGQLTGITYGVAVWSKNGRNVKSVRVIYRAGLQGTPSAPFGSFERLKELAGFKLEQFAPTIWNLLPYSFLVDYFLNLGDVLECTATNQRAVAWVNRTVIYGMTYFQDAWIDEAYAKTIYGPNANRSVSGSGYGYALNSFSRVVRSSSALSIPTLEFRMPAVDSAKWLNVAALIVQGKVTSKGLAAL